jgi:hypothetical protein
MYIYVYEFTNTIKPTHTLSLSLSHTHTFVYVYTEMDGADKWTTSLVKGTPKALPALINAKHPSQAGELLGKNFLAKYRTSISGYTRKLEFYDEILGLVGDSAAGESKIAEMDFKIKIPKIGFSMVATDRQEILYASIHNIAFHRNETLGRNTERHYTVT